MFIRRYTFGEVANRQIIIFAKVELFKALNSVNFILGIANLKKIEGGLEMLRGLVFAGWYVSGGFDFF